MYISIQQIYTMSTIKHITSSLFPPISDIHYEMENTQRVLNTMLSTRFVSEHNTNTYDYASKVLESYCYVPSINTLWNGRYVRYLDMRNTFGMTLKVGGFALHDNGYTVTLKNENRTFNVAKRNHLWFMVITTDDVKRINMMNLLK
jgi:hypothetical protein